jgi:hypothetical protein
VQLIRIQPSVRQVPGSLRWCLLLLAWTLPGCEPELVVGAWQCNPSDASIPDARVASESAPVEVPWSTSFEDDFCDFERAGGFCYAAPLAHFDIVTAPVHSGRQAAAFSVRAGDDNAHQTRCVRQGVLPREAYYGAWYFIPQSARNTALWNLIHFRGGSDSAAEQGLWDISLENDPDGALSVFVFDFLHGMVHRPMQSNPVPIGAWFHLELYLQRAADATGEVALYQDGEKVVEIRNIVTDDTRQAQWYIGNLATGLAPAESTLYVDDVTIRSTR